jgi:hypothetical protein
MNSETKFLPVEESNLFLKEFGRTRKEVSENFQHTGTSDAVKGQNKRFRRIIEVVVGLERIYYEAIDLF